MEGLDSRVYNIGLVSRVCPGGPNTYTVHAVDSQGEGVETVDSVTAHG